MRNVKTSDAITKTLFTWPSIIIVGIILFVPIAIAVFLSFTNYNGISRMDFVGVDNYVKLFTSKTFPGLIGNNIYFLLLGVPLYTFIPLIFAVILYDITRGAQFYKTAFVLPKMLSAVVVGILFRLIFSYNGVANEVFSGIGLGRLVTDWLAHGSTSVPIITSAVMWSTFGVNALIFLAAMSAIPVDVYESASLDGAGWWRRLFKITLPMIKNTVELVTVMGVIEILSGLFGYIFTITDGGPGYESSTLEYMLYLQGFRLNALGYACAIAVVLCILMLIITNVIRRVFRDKEAA